MSRTEQWDTRAPFTGPLPHLNRHLGVTVSTPFHHHGLGETYVDISRETPYVNTEMFGGSYPVAKTSQRVAGALQGTIDDLDRLIKELTAHRDRLAIALFSVATRDFATELPAAAAPRGKA